MAKFETSRKNLSRDEIVAMAKANKLPNPKKSSCPFYDGQEVKFKSWDAMEWTNGTQKGVYLVMFFEDNDNAYPVSMLFKTAFGFDTASDAYAEENIKEFTNTGGLFEKLKGFSAVNEEFFKAVEDYFGNKKKKIRLTPFYVKDRYGRVALHNLCNIV